MRFSSFQSALIALSAAQTVLGHAGMSNFYINGQNQGDAVCVRMNTNSNTWSNSIEDLNSSDMACGFTGIKGVNRVCPVPDGATLTFEWREDANKPGGSVIDISHMGPCAVYMKRVDSAAADTAAGAGWFKIWHEGYDEATQQWCTKKLIDNGGFLSVNIPQGLAGGEYLVRSELLALHEAEKGDPQYYIGCAQISLQSSGNLVPSSSVAIPGTVSKTDKSNSFNLYNKPLALPYPPPGPAIASLVSGASSNVKSVQSPSQSGGKPANCICESGSNFCGVEVSSYGGADSCWPVSESCWDQAKLCYSTAPPTGDAACVAWEKKCTAIQADCQAGRAGPPNKGTVITPARKNLAVIPAPLGSAGSGGLNSTAPVAIATAGVGTPSVSAAPHTTLATVYSSACSSPVPKGDSDYVINHPPWKNAHGRGSRSPERD